MKIKNLRALLISVSCTAILPLTSLAAPSTPVKPVRDIQDIQVDEEQLRQAVASRTLTWLTGSSSNNDYISVGRLANFFGFVALRVSSGHSLSRSGVAKETLHALNEKQRGALIDLVQQQKDVFSHVKEARFDMNRALEGLLVGEDISQDQFLILGEAYGAAEAELGRVIGQTLGEVASSLTSSQKETLKEIRARHISGTAENPKMRGVKSHLSKEDKKELVNIAARLLSWSTGNSEFNDFEVVGKPSQHFGFVSLRLESNHGVKRGAIANEVRDLLNADQKRALNAAASHNILIFDDFLSTRGQLMRALEVALAGEDIDPATVHKLGKEIGRKEAEMTWAQAMAMLDVRHSMSDAQLKSLLSMRAKYTGNSFDTLPEDPFARGRQIFAQCVLCHNDKSDYAIAPSLINIMQKNIASDAGFENYSQAIQAYAQKQISWTDETLDAFLKSPKDLIPGTYMGYSGLEDSKDRKALITYLKSRH